MSEQQKSDREIVFTQFEHLEQSRKAQALQLMISFMKRKRQFSDADVLGRFRMSVPLSIFSQDKLSCLESIVKYFKETKSMRFGAIAKMLNRDNRTIWATYAIAIKKMPEPLRAEGVEMPAVLIADRTLSVLEHVVKFSKSLGMKNHEVALLLHLDDRTIWSVYDKIKKKGRR